MFFITKQIGNRVFVFDDTDGSVEFLDKGTVQRYMQEGMINGTRPDIVSLNEPLIVAPEQCNWLPNAVNIWASAERVICKSPREGKYILKSGGKQFKFTYIRDRELLAFTNGIFVRVDARIKSMLS